MKTSEKHKDELIVIMDENSMEREYLITYRANFENKRLCETYDDFGQAVGCYNGSCYSLANLESEAPKDCSIALIDHLMVNLSDKEKDEVQSWLEEGDYDYLPDCIESEASPSEAQAFIAAWQEENEYHTECTVWDYWDGSNWQSVVIETEFGEDTTYKEVDEELSEKILSQYPGQIYFDGVSAEEESADFVFRYSRCTDDPWLSHIFTK